MEQEPSSNKNILESIPESGLKKMAGGLDWLGLTMGIDIKEGDYLIKSEKEHPGGGDDGDVHNLCCIEGEINGKGLRISRVVTYMKRFETLTYNFILWERLGSKEPGYDEYKPVCEAGKEERIAKDLLSRYKGLEDNRYLKFFETQKGLFTELQTLYEALEKVAITVNNDES